MDTKTAELLAHSVLNLIEVAAARQEIVGVQAEADRLASANPGSGLTVDGIARLIEAQCANHPGSGVMLGSSGGP